MSEQDEELQVVAYALVRDEGSVVVFHGTEDVTGDSVTFAVERRYAQDLIDDPDGTAFVPEWAVIGRTAKDGQSPLFDVRPVGGDNNGHLHTEG